MPSQTPSEPSSTAPSSSEPSPSSEPPAIELVGLTKTYREGRSERTVLEDVDLTIARGELVVLLGRSGSGKSTLLNLVSGIDQPSAGTVRVGGRDLTRASERERTLFRRHSIGFVFQFFNLVPTLTVEENLLLPLELAGTVEEADRRRAVELLERVGLADRRDTFPERLSGGEQQRVAVARALAHDPLLVLADEPTGNLDLETGLTVLELLDDLTRRAGKTMVMVTHAREVVGIADRVLTIQDARLEEVPRERLTGSGPTDAGGPSDDDRLEERVDPGDVADTAADAADPVDAGEPR